MFTNCQPQVADLARAASLRSQEAATLSLKQKKMDPVELLAQLDLDIDVSRIPRPGDVQEVGAARAGGGKMGMLKMCCMGSANLVEWYLRLV